MSMSGMNIRSSDAATHFLRVSTMYTFFSLLPSVPGRRSVAKHDSSVVSSNKPEAITRACTRQQRMKPVILCAVHVQCIPELSNCATVD